jgi:hypothetical protein
LGNEREINGEILHTLRSADSRLCCYTAGFRADQNLVIRRRHSADNQLGKRVDTMQDKLKTDAFKARTLNLQGAEQAKPAPIPNWFNSRERETGERFKIVCIELCKRFGGYTAHDTRGGWLHDGKLVKEESTTFETSFVNEADVESAREVFTLAGLLLGNDWIHIECHTFQALHTKAQS